MNKWQKFKIVFPDTLPVLAGYLFLGIIYGILMNSKGFGPFWSLLASSMLLAGSLQYALITFLTLAFNPIQAFILSITINARHFFYGLTMLKRYQGTGKVKNILIYGLTDETYSIVSSKKVPEGISEKDYYLYVSVINYLYWVSASFIGGFIGELSKISIKGFDFALTALFLIILLDLVKEKRNQFPAIIGIVASVVCLFIFGNNFIIPSMVVIAAALLLMEPTISKGERP